jgi:hypothetical protein
LGGKGRGIGRIESFEDSVECTVRPCQKDKNEGAMCPVWAFRNNEVELKKDV